VLVQVEEDDDGEEQVRVTGMVDWDFAGVVHNGWSPPFLASSVPLRRLPMTTATTTMRVVEYSLFGSKIRILGSSPRIKNDNRLASVWRDTLDKDEGEHQWEKDELVRAAWEIANVEWHEVQRGCTWGRGYLASCYHHQPPRLATSIHKKSATSPWMFSRTGNVRLVGIVVGQMIPRRR